RHRGAGDLHRAVHLARGRHGRRPRVQHRPRPGPRTRHGRVLPGDLALRSGRDRLLRPLPPSDHDRRDHRSQLMNATIVAIAGAYLLIVLLIGLWATRRTKDSGDFYIAGRSLGVLVMA